MAAAAPLSDVRDVPGWYGKLASLGDFAHRRLPPEWLRACDGWLAVALPGARERLGERWLEVYLTAPLLRFAWAPGVVDSQWWFGLLMPSCDSVGRYYPLVVVHPRTQPPQDRIALDHLECWYERVGQAAVRTLNDAQGSVDALESALQEVPPWPTPGRGPAIASQADATGEHHRLGRAAPLSQWLHALAARELGARLAGCTVWWRTGAAGGDDTIDVLHGLPDGAALARLLSGAAPSAH
jgi:type VI secretion system protein ImpM